MLKKSVCGGGGGVDMHAAYVDEKTEWHFRTEWLLPTFFFKQNLSTVSATVEAAKYIAASELVQGSCGKSVVQKVNNCGEHSGGNSG